MLFRIADDWKQLMTPEDESRLNSILKSVQKHRSAYRVSKDVKSAQLWCAVLELHKQNQVLYKKVKRMEFVFEGIADRMKKEYMEEKDILEALDKF